MSEHSRREALQIAGGAAVVAGAVGVLAGELAAPQAAASAATLDADGVLDLFVNEGLVPMVDDSLVYMRGFGASPTDVGSPSPSLRISPVVFLADGRLVGSRTYPLGATLPAEGRPDPLAPHPTNPGEYLIRRQYWASFFPDRTIVAETGSTVRVRVHNRLSKPHRLQFVGVPAPNGAPGDADTGSIAPGATASLSFPAPRPGTYAYQDPGGGPSSGSSASTGCSSWSHPLTSGDWDADWQSSSASGSGCARTSTRSGPSGRARVR